MFKKSSFCIFSLFYQNLIVCIYEAKFITKAFNTFFLIFTVSSAFMFLLTSNAYSAPPAPWEIDELIGNPAPDFILKAVDGKSVSLSSFRGKVVLINFWATWCPPCKEEMPSMNSLYNLLKDKGFLVVAISNDNSIKKIKSFLSENPVNFVILNDPSIKVSREYKVFSLPTSFLIDRDGKILKKYLGGQQWMNKEIQKEIKDLL